MSDFIEHSCDGDECPLPVGRRRFLRDAFLSAAGALVAVGMTESVAMAMPLAFVEPTTKQSSHLVNYAVPAADGAQIDKGNEVILVRWQNMVIAFNLSCPHQNTALKWDDRDHSFSCPKHHSRFQPDGSYIADSGRATRNMDRFAIAHDGGGVHVDLDKLYQEDTDGPLWTAAVVKLV
jgi:Rieske Fe-S protein